MSYTKIFRMIAVIFSLLCVGLQIPTSSASTSEADLETAASAPVGVGVAEPNIGALLGLAGGPHASGNVGLLKGLGGHPLAQSGGGFTPNLQALRDSGVLENICNSNGNSDALTNLLVYQYLSGSLPGGTSNSAPVPNAARAVAAVGNPQLQALLEGSMESRTKTSVTTTLTTRTITMDPSTKFSTSTTSYVTTITSLASSVLPIIFRGSKITTTITDKKTEVLTATEFLTSSSVLTPSIIQTLNVEVTLTETSTKGLNGHFTLAQVNPGATKIIEQPISSTNIDFDTQGLDLSSIDLSTLDLAGFRGTGKSGDNAQVVKALTALLKQYGDEPVDSGNSQDKGKGREREQRNYGNTRFHTRSRISPENDEPKFNVIRGFTLSDRPPSRSETEDNSGTALENTRYSKFRKKNNVQNNSLRTPENDRESERYSASTSRRTVSRAAHPRAERRRETVIQERKYPSASSSDFESPEGGRTNRQIERNRKRFGRTSRGQVIRENEIIVNQNKITTFTTTLLTMHISGIKPGEIITTVRTVTLRGFGSARGKRHSSPSVVSLIEPITNTKVPVLSQESEDVIRLLKDLDQSAVRTMLHSLHDWVNYYLHQVLDETIEPSFSANRVIETNDIADLRSSHVEEESSSVSDATALLSSLPTSITRDPPMASQIISDCPKVSIITKTVYQTIVISDPR